MFCILLEVDQSIEIKCQMYRDCCKNCLISKQNKKQNLLSIFINGTTLWEGVVFLSVTLSCLAFGYWPGLYQNSASNPCSASITELLFIPNHAVSYTHTLSTRFSCLLTTRHCPQNLVQSNNFVKYVTFDKTGYAAKIYWK